MKCSSLQKAVSILGVVTALGGCSLFTHPSQRPVVTDVVADVPVAGTKEFRPVKALNITAGRRMLLVNGANGRVCAEAPPDATENAASIFTGNAKFTSEYQAALAAGAAVQFDSLFHRTQGIQFFRDAAWHLCVQYMNGIIEPSEYVAKYSALADSAMALTEFELKGPPQDHKNSPSKQDPSIKSFSERLLELQKSGDALKPKSEGGG